MTRRLDSLPPFGGAAITIVSQVDSDDLIIKLQLPLTPEDWCSLCMPTGKSFLGHERPEAHNLAVKFFLSGGDVWADELLQFRAYSRGAEGHAVGLLHHVCENLEEDLAHGSAVGRVYRENTGILLDTLENAIARLRIALRLEKGESSILTAQLLPLLRQSVSVLENLPLPEDLWAVFDTATGELCSGPHGLAIFSSWQEARSWVDDLTHDTVSVTILPVTVGDGGVTLDASRVEASYIEA